MLAGMEKACHLGWHGEDLSSWLAWGRPVMLVGMGRTCHPGWHGEDLSSLLAWARHFVLADMVKTRNDITTLALYGQF